VSLEELQQRSLWEWQDLKDAKLSRDLLDCECPNDGRVVAGHLWCDRLACEEHADDAHDCPGAPAQRRADADARAAGTSAVVERIDDTLRAVEGPLVYRDDEHHNHIGLRNAIGGIVAGTPIEAQIMCTWSARASEELHAAIAQRLGPAALPTPVAQSAAPSRTLATALWWCRQLLGRQR
jgi:hypothetical protein